MGQYGIILILIVVFVVLRRNADRAEEKQEEAGRMQSRDNNARLDSPMTNERTKDGSSD